MASKKIKRKSLLPKTQDPYIYYSVIFLAIIGILMTTSASMGTVSGNLEKLFKLMIKQSIFALVGYICMVIFTNIYTHKRCSKSIGEIVIFTGIALLIPLFCESSGGAHAWIKIPGVDFFSIQPAEFAKISVILILSTYLGDKTKKEVDTKTLCKKPLITVLLFVFIVVILQSDMGSGLIMFVVASIIFLIPKHKALYSLQKKLLLFGVAGVVFVIFLLTPAGDGFIKALPLANYQINRILSAKNPFLDKYNTGYQLIKGLTAFASGGLSGLGFGNSIQKYTNFPASNTDYILAITVEEIGFLGFVVIFSLYFTIIIRLFMHAYRTKSEKDQMILIGVATIFFVHAVFNIGGVTGLIPLTGVPLLLLSSGGSSTMASMTAIGIAQAVIAQKNKNN